MYPIFKNKRRTTDFHLPILWLIGFCLMISMNVSGQQKQNIRTEIEQIRNAYENATDDSIRLAQITLLAQRYRFVDIDSSKLLLWKALHLHRKLDANRPLRAFAYNVIANIYRLEPNVDSAMFYYQEAYDFFTQENEYRFIQSIAPPFASFLVESGEIERGLGMFHEAINLAESKKDYHSLTFLYEYFGETILNVQKDEKRAIELFMKGIAASQNIKDDTINYDRVTTSLSLNLSNIYLNNYQADSAITYADQAITFGNRAKILQLVVEAYNNMSRSYILKKEYAKAHEYNQAAYQLNQNIKNIFARIESETITQLIHLKTQNYQQCISSGNNLLNSYEEHIKNEQKAEVFEYLCECYTYTGNTPKALAAKDSLLSYTKRGFDIQQTELISKLDKQYQVAQKETENELLRTQKEVANKTARSRTAIAVGIFAVLLLLAGWSYFIFRNNQQRKALNEQLEITVNERTAELQEANKDLEQANYELRTFNYIASHDIKEPIRNIGNYAGFIFRKLPDDLKSSLGFYFDTIKRSTTQLYTLVEDFSKYTQLSEETNIETQTIDLNEFIESFTISLDTLLKEKNGKIVNEGLPIIQSNTSLIYTILKNLIENGLKFNQSATPIVTVSATADEQFYKIHIRDNGIGIEEEYHEKIFEMFKRLHHRGEYEGSGIGLAIVKLCVNKLDGKVKLESEVGKGSRFVLLLPR